MSKFIIVSYVGLLMRFVVLLSVLVVIGCRDGEQAAQAAQAAQAVPSEEPQMQQSASLFDRRALSQAIDGFIESSLRQETEAERKRLRASGEDPENLYVYSSSYREIREVDLDDDGDLDALILVDACEESSCNTSTRFAKVGLLMNDGSGFELTQVARFDGPTSLRGFTDEGVEVESMTYGPDDPTCCPSKTKRGLVRIPRSSGF